MLFERYNIIESMTIISEQLLLLKRVYSKIDIHRSVKPASHNLFDSLRD